MVNIKLNNTFTKKTTKIHQIFVFKKKKKKKNCCKSSKKKALKK